jgi:hypothetical protein
MNWTELNWTELNWTEIPLFLCIDVLRNYPVIVV